MGRSHGVPHVAAQGLDVPVLSNLPGYVPALLDTPAAPALVKNLYVVQSQVPFESEGLGLGLRHRETDQHGTFEPSGDDRNAGGEPEPGARRGSPGRGLGAVTAEPAVLSRARARRRRRG